MIDNIKKYIIKKFIETEARIPTRSELIELYRNELKKNNFIEEQGLSAGEPEAHYWNSNEESNGEKTNDFFQRTFLDLEYLDEGLEELLNTQRETFIDRQRIVKNFESKLKLLEKKLDGDILLKSGEDLFSHSVFEDFSDGAFFNYETSNAEISNSNKVTIGHWRSSEEAIEASSISYRVVHRRGSQVDSETLGSVEALLAEDSNFLSVKTYSNINNDIVELIISLDFVIPKSIQEIKLILGAHGGIQEETWCSVDGINYESLRDIIAAENVSNLIHNISFPDDSKTYKSIRIILRKTAHDREVDEKYEYSFVLDYIGFQRLEYKSDAESVFYLGPYYVTDEEGENVNFTMASIKGGTCCEIPERSSVDIYLSKDGVIWKRGEFGSEFNNVIKFVESSGNAKNFDVFDILDAESTNRFTAIELPFESEYSVLNLYVPEENRNKILRNSIKIKRNVLYSKRNNTENWMSGWVKVNNNRWKCNFTINDPEGKYVDFGDTGVTLNGATKSSRTFLRQGSHEIQIDSRFFNTKDEDDEKKVSSIRELRRFDQHYPYNHKYIIEGFNYKSGFRGKKVYSGMNEIFASSLKKMSENKFRANADYNNFFLKEDSGNLYIIVKDYPGVGMEEFDISFQKEIGSDDPSAEENRLFIKGILKTEDGRYSPKVSQIQVRVI